MKFITELLMINESRISWLSDIQELFEDLGNLKNIDRGLIRVFQQQSFDGGKKKSIGDMFGRKSKMIEYVDKNQTVMFNRLSSKEDAHGIPVGLIVKYDEKQVLAIIKIISSSYKNEDSYLLAGNNNFFEKTIDSQKYEELMGYNAKSYGTWDFQASNLIKGEVRGIKVTIGKIKTLLKELFLKAKTDKVEIKTIIIYRDTERIETSKQREQSREGIIPYSTGNLITVNGKKITYETWGVTHFKALGRDLSKRLEKFKITKAKSFDNPQELLDGFMKEGYLEHVRLMGFPYELKRHQISFNDIVSGKMILRDDDNYVEYEIKTNSIEIEKLNKELKDIKETNDTDADDLSKIYYETKKEMLPPRNFKVILKMEGGAIVPGAIKISNERVWIY